MKLYPSDVFRRDRRLSRLQSSFAVAALVTEVALLVAAETTRAVIDEANRRLWGPR